jgi:MOFRL family
MSRFSDASARVFLRQMFDAAVSSADPFNSGISPDTLTRAHAISFDARSFLAGHDSYSLFKSPDDLVITGPTLTNVNDFRALLFCLLERTADIVRCCKLSA